MLSVGIVCSTPYPGAIVPFTLPSDLVLQYGYCLGTCFLSTDPTATSLDWNGVGSLTTGQYDSLIAIMSFTWTPQLNFHLSGGQTLYCAFNGQDTLQLIFDGIS